MFEPYFLVPWLFGVNVVLLEIAIVTRRRSMARWMMAAPAALLLLSTWTVVVPNVIGLRPMLMESIGCTPLFLTLMAATLLYAVALLRRIPGSFECLTGGDRLARRDRPREHRLATGLFAARLASACPAGSFAAWRRRSNIEKRSALADGGGLARLRPCASIGRKSIAMRRRAANSPHVVLQRCC